MKKIGECGQSRIFPYYTRRCVGRRVMKYSLTLCLLSVIPFLSALRSAFLLLSRLLQPARCCAARIVFPDVRARISFLSAH
ncbi:hypothetical protein [Dickeya sp. CFBP 2040]|uniref:hypothetical protein n=1 Tax=Dickeya sp. CFBP 2040 TaxID=2718531 RepID=UPI001447854C|nr:hypothetical protein [Dickeya sp. CFBP 2040]